MIILLLCSILGVYSGAPGLFKAPTLLSKSSQPKSSWDLTMEEFDALQNNFKRSYNDFVKWGEKLHELKMQASDEILKELFGNVGRRDFKKEIRRCGLFTHVEADLKYVKNVCKADSPSYEFIKDILSSLKESASSCETLPVKHKDEIIKIYEEYGNKPTSFLEIEESIMEAILQGEGSVGFLENMLGVGMESNAEMELKDMDNASEDKKVKPKFIELEKGGVFESVVLIEDNKKSDNLSEEEIEGDLVEELEDVSEDLQDSDEGLIQQIDIIPPVDLQTGPEEILESLEEESSENLESEEEEEEESLQSVEDADETALISVEETAADEPVLIDAEESVAESEQESEMVEEGQDNNSEIKEEANDIKTDTASEQVSKPASEKVDDIKSVDEIIENPLQTIIDNYAKDTENLCNEFHELVSQIIKLTDSGHIIMNRFFIE
ncbi:unnamed protein product [Blepharisma stoltei]|uniref:Uncharacterized protein n=1 Tax=Blepharisma stoltei TaxID=1481888 RepID=A0AAU9J708_9CILI|nr:unnamed protein product [Blepharisma stoltei]